MPCAVLMANSPVFSPSRGMSPSFCGPSVSSPVSLGFHNSTPSTPSYSQSSTPLPSLALRLHKQANEPRRNEPICSTLSSTSTLLKRKRPVKIEIPVVSLSFHSTVQMPAADRLNDDMEVEGEGYSVYCKRGKRGAMEDRYSAVVGIQGDSKQALFGVFDGHGGAKAAEYAAKNLDKSIINEITTSRKKGTEEAIRDGYLTTDAGFLKDDDDVRGGTCCVTALIRNGDLIVSNTGDCRAVMSHGGVAEALTVDHRPSREDEKDRIQNMGGYVDKYHGVWRVQGSLAVSRGIGDGHLKQWVIAEPDTTTLRIMPECEFLILASDGLWDKVSNQEAVDIIRPLLSCVDDAHKLQLCSACKKLADLSAARGSTDDVTVMVIMLGGFMS